PVTGFVTLERRLAGPLSLMGRVAASFGSTTASADSVVVDATSTGASVMGALGLKVSFGSRDTLEVSPFALLDGAYGWAGGAAAHAFVSSLVVAVKEATGKGSFCAFLSCYMKLFIGQLLTPFIVAFLNFAQDKLPLKA
ncbi:MAG TPA: hypothetical protein PKW73_05700, partial [Candidatus Obscuribacter sp.]|nr:hypothetical protein [Candidatus Obscuribacter sp.]